MFGLQPLHLFIILIIALIIFGPKRLPEMGQALGKSVREFRAAMTNTGEEIKKGLNEGESEAGKSNPDVQTKA